MLGSVASCSSNVSEHYAGVVWAKVCVGMSDSSCRVHEARASVNKPPIVAAAEMQIMLIGVNSESNVHLDS